MRNSTRRDSLLTTKHIADLPTVGRLLLEYEVGPYLSSAYALSMGPCRRCICKEEMAARRLATVFLLAAIVAQAADATLSLSSTSSRRRSPAPPPAPIPPIPPQSSGLPPTRRNKRHAESRAKQVEMTRGGEAPRLR